MTTEHDMAQSLTKRTMELLVEEAQVPIPAIGGLASEADYLRVRPHLAALSWTLAEMDAHQLAPVAAHLLGVLNREPLKSGSMWEPHRIVYGLVLLALRDIAAELDPDTLTVDLIPPWYARAVEAGAAMPVPPVTADLLEDLDTPSPDDAAPTDEENLDAWLA